VRREVTAAAEDWLEDYLELVQNVDVVLLGKGDPNAGTRAELALVPRQPRNIRKATLGIDLAVHLPVHFDVEFPLKRQIVAFANMKVGQPIDAAIFGLTLPAGLSWTDR
jgi:hypothetical protein